MAQSTGKKYTYLFAVLNDTDLYIAQRFNNPLNLGQIQALAQARWTWLVANWSTIFQRFKTFANGNDNLEALLKLFDNAVTSWNLGNNINPLASVGNFIDFNPFLTTISLLELKLSSAETILIDQELFRVSNFTVEDFQAMLTYLRTESAYAAQAVGLGDADAARLLGITQVSQKRSATIADLARIDDALGLEMFIQGIIIDLKQTADKPPNLLAIANANLDPNSTASFNTSYKSSVAVPFEISLESMAKKYLGSADLFFELATINNLQPPYVDQVGQKLLLLAPGAVNNLIVPDTLVESMPVGTKINIGSYRIREEPRIIEKLIDNGDGTLIIYLSGSQDLSKLKVTEGAFIRVFSPGTVNNGSFILIPLTTPSQNGNKFTPTSEALRELDVALFNFGVDIAADEKTGALLLDGNGDLMLQYGIANVRQAVLFALKTQKGELPFHLTFGISVNIGGKYYGTVDEAALFASSVRKSLLRDPRYQDVQIAQLRATNTGIALTLLVSIQGAKAPIPLSFIS